MSVALNTMVAASCGHTPMAGAALGCNHVEGWLIELDKVSADLLERLRGVLSADEVARAERFHFELHRRRFVATRGALRFLLSRHLEEDPSGICFDYGPAGKPFLKTTEPDRVLYFNVTHAENLAVVGITRAGEIGIDLERVRVFSDWEQVAIATFSSEQVEALRACAEAWRPEMFFRAWTREEARVKALGVGLGDDGRVRDAAGLRVQTFQIPPSFLLSFAVPFWAYVPPLRTWEGEAVHASFSASASGSAEGIRPTCC